jgi:hypothetical protein
MDVLCWVSGVVAFGPDVWVRWVLSVSGGVSVLVHLIFRKGLGF